MCALAEGLVRNRTGALTSLNVSHCGVGHGGAGDASAVQMLAAALKANDKLATVYMAGNIIGSAGAQHLVPALNGAKHLREMAVSPIGVDRVVFDMLLAWLE